VEVKLKIHKAGNIRNIVLAGHESTGKTIFAEAVLKVSGMINRMGAIDANNTVSDFTQFEQERQKSISCTLMQTEWNETKLNLLDTPGFSDFFGETISGMHVADIAVIMVNPINGPEVITEMVMETVNARSMPCMFVFNMLDKEHTKFDEELDALQSTFKGVAPMQYPLEVGENFSKIVDIIKHKILVFDADGNFTEEDLGSEADKVNELFASLEETVAESDDALMEVYLEEMELSEEQFSKGLADGINNGSIRPVFCAAGKKLVGVTRVMDMLVESFPSPDKMPAFKATDENEEIEIACDENGSPRFMIYKIVSEQHVGELCFFRMYSGNLAPGTDLVNSGNGNSEKIGSLFTVFGKHREDLQEIHAGDMGCTVKLKNSHTNDTLCVKGDSTVMEKIPFPDPVMRTAIAPEKEDDDEKMAVGLHTIRHEDPSFTLSQDSELHQTILAGQGDQQFNLLLEKLEVRYGVKVKQFKPKVPYRETITTDTQVKYRHKKQTGGAGQFAEVWVTMKPGERGTGFNFTSTVVGGSVTVPFQQATEKGMRQVMVEGIVAGCRVEDVVVNIYDGKMHQVDSKEIAFQTAGREAFKIGFRECNPILLEPIWEVEVKVPEEFMGDVMGDLSSRRGKILGMEAVGKNQLIKALVPLAELYQYSTTLRSMTSGRASHRRHFDHYEKCPPDVQVKVIEDYEAERAKD
jgi:elongation factor G